jgi:hypothetical protein
MSTNSLWDDLENQTGERPEYWKPEIGDSLRGTLAEVQELEDTYNPGQKSLLILVRDEGGQLWSWFPPTAPRRTIIERFLAGVMYVGGPFGAKRLEDLRLKNGSMLKMFALVPRPSTEDAQTQAKRIMESRKGELPEDKQQLELPGVPAKKAPKPRGAQEVQTRTEINSQTGIEEDIPL